MTYKNPMNAKNLISTRLREDLMGPLRADEVLEAYPSDVYLTGILFPQKTDNAREDDNCLAVEGAGFQEPDSDAKEEVSLSSSKRPASIGISFAVKSPTVPLISIQLEGAYYEPIVYSGDSNSGRKWLRRPFSAQLTSINVEFPYRKFTEREIGITGLTVYVRATRWGDDYLLTVAMINESPYPDQYSREAIERASIFQALTKVRCEGDSHFIPRPLGGSAQDEDTKVSKLIYRDVEEFAVGHTCSASWVKENKVEWIATEWLPAVVVKPMSSIGDEVFLPLSEQETGPILSTEWLASADDKILLEGLGSLPALYLKWITEESARIDSLNLDCCLKEQAVTNIAAAKQVAHRIFTSIKLLGSNPTVLTAFKLANRAILVQSRWASSEKEPKLLVWRPFQLAFILLSLESVANKEHTDRGVVDLLWFPTGGGKTEAYLALIAFVIFLRRLRDGDAGGGVCAFMRYTLRLLTVQQFQRAAALVCACDAIRCHHPSAGINTQKTPDLGISPISIGLWVGGDATPNNFEKSKEALANPTAHNRPDQIKFCPVHRDKLLTWSADEKQEKTIARCPEDTCCWNQANLPVWTVDTDIYTEAPSLVVGTVDKFAQITRQPKTKILFGGCSEKLPPDLIIQDELHLISGPLGSMSGLFETAIDYICSRGGARPKVIASTATIRMAKEQIRAIFDRDTCLFPPPVIDSNNSGFSVQDENGLGRLYIGVTTAGRSAKFTLQAVSASIMQTVASVEIPAEERDAFWTLVNYFNAIRELGGALVLMQDDVPTSLRNIAARRNEKVRDIQELMELTSRVDSTTLKDYLNQLEFTQGTPGCCDAVLASNMISVGVDVSRLGMMIVNGQPKTFSEYIQATSRVGRKQPGPGGLVITLYNNAKARDRSCYESFQTWHRALYREVEATSVTPFAARARSKALHAVLVILARHLIDDLESSPCQVEDHDEDLELFINHITKRCESIDPEESSRVATELNNFLEDWQDHSAELEYYWADKKPRRSLLISAEIAAELRARTGMYTSRAVPTPNSMRSVEAATQFELKESLK